MKFYWGVIFLLLLTRPILAQQEIKSLPVQFSQYMRAYPQINPASSGSVSNLEIYTGNQRHGQSWSNINTFYFNANLRFYRKGVKSIDRDLDPDGESEEEMEDSETEIEPQVRAVPVNFHVAGINIVNDKEGSYFNRSGFYGIYAWHGKLREKLFLAAGVSAGLKNIAISDNDVYGGRSSFAPDGSAGLWMYDDNYHIGLSVGQLFNSKLKPLFETTRLLPYYNLTAARVFKLNPFVSLKPSFLARFSSNISDLDLTLGSLWQDIISATVNYRVNKGITTMIGIEKISFGNSYFKAMISYTIPQLKSTQINNYTYEITLNYFYKVKTRNGKVFL